MRQPLVANPQAPEGVIEPRERALDDPALGEDGAEGAAVIALVRDEAARAVAPADAQPIQGGDGAAPIMVGGRHEGEGQGYALGIDDQGALRLVETDLAGRADTGPPFFAGTALASSLVASSRSLSCRLSLTSRAAHTRSQVPSCIQALRRRWQVAGLPYFAGRSCQRQPVRST